MGNSVNVNLFHYISPKCIIVGGLSHFVCSCLFFMEIYLNINSITVFNYGCYFS